MIKKENDDTFKVLYVLPAYARAVNTILDNFHEVDVKVAGRDGLSEKYWNNGDFLCSLRRCFKSEHTIMVLHLIDCYNF